MADFTVVAGSAPVTAVGDSGAADPGSVAADSGAGGVAGFVGVGAFGTSTLLRIMTTLSHLE